MLAKETPSLRTLLSKVLFARLKNGLYLVVVIGVWKADKFSAAIDNYVKGFYFQLKPVSLFTAVGNIWWISFHLCHQDGNRKQVGAQMNTSAL
ncbi:hypothetical protein TNCV_4926251 [Trichonephila clavipes]|nr:hypothetical protein TNCV_4926251 [Trichonephila clavipes]